MPKPYPQEFRDDVVRVAQTRQTGVSIDQIAKDFGIHPITLRKRMRKADVEAGITPGATAAESQELREDKRRVRLLEQKTEVLRRAAAYLSQANLPGKGGTRTSSELAADGIPVTVTCRVLGIARQPYYQWLKCPVTDAERAETYRANALFDAHREDHEFGYRYLADEATAAGEAMCRRTAWRISSTNGWTSTITRRSCGRHRKAGPPVHDDMVKRVFTAEAPNRL